ncbi:MAG: nitroreductase family protein [Bdellovibrionales bacterium]|nr:nitroreductase family protein [Bdellovibrionales bacterium]
MDIREMILTRRTVNNYTPEKVPDSVVEEALALSLWAPNHKLTYPWVYTWLGAETRARLGDLNAELKGANPIKAKAARDNVVTPSHLISLAIKRSEKVERQHEDYATLSCSVQIATMFLWQHGIATKWSTGGWSMHPRAYEIIGLSPEEVKLEGCLMIGRPQIMPPTPERPPLAQFLRRTT